MPRKTAPVARRRTVLKLLAGSIAGLGGLRTGFAAPAESPVRLGDSFIQFEFDTALHSRVGAREGTGFAFLTDFDPGETLRLADGKRIDRFAFIDQRREDVADAHGSGTRYVLRGLAEGI